MTNVQNKIALGTVQFGVDYGISNSMGKTSEDQVCEILNVANQNGIDLLDTAQAYGLSEEVVGRHHQNRFKIVTKINSNVFGKRLTTKAIQESLKNLKVESLYGVLFHSNYTTSNNLQSYLELVSLKNRKKIEKIGLSAYSIIEIETYISEFGNPEILQIPYNIVDKRFEKIIIDLHKEGVEIHSRSTFLQGLFFMETGQLPNHFENIKPFIDDLHKRFKKKDELANFLLTDVLEKSFIDKVIIGVNDSAQLKSNLSNFNLETLSLTADSIPVLSEEILNPSLWPKN